MEANQVYAVQLPNELVQLRDLPPRVLGDIAKRNGVSWMQVLDAPLNDVGVAMDLLRTIASLYDDAEFPEPLRVRDLVTLCANTFILVDKDEADRTAQDAVAVPNLDLAEQVAAVEVVSPQREDGYIDYRAS